MRPRKAATGGAALVAALVLALAPPTGAAERRLLDLSAGYFHGTKPSQPGFVLGVGTRFLTRGPVTVGLYAQYAPLQKTLEQSVTGRNGTSVVVRDKQSRHYFPVLLTGRYSLSDRESMAPYLLGSVGWATLRSYHDNEVGKGSRSFHGPVAEAGVGVSIRPRLFLEGAIHAGSAKRGSDESRLATPIDESASPNGIAIRAGFRL